MTNSLASITNNISHRDPATTLIRISEVTAIVGLARPTIYKLMQCTKSGFPRTSTARGAPVAWVLAEVQAWARGRIEARDQVAA